VSASWTNFNRRTTLEALFAENDVELFDLQRDPSEMHNLALDRDRNEELLLAMNEKRNAAIEGEVGSDTGDGLPIRDEKVQIQIRKRGRNFDILTNKIN
jgi:hypothetical protein